MYLIPHASIDNRTYNAVRDLALGKLLEIVPLRLLLLRFLTKVAREGGHDGCGIL